MARSLQVLCEQKVINLESLHANHHLLDSMNDASGGRITFNKPFDQTLAFIEATRRRINIASSAFFHRPLYTEEIRPGRSAAWKQVHSAVVNARFSGATSQRDKIYALLGLMDMRNAPGASLPMDYTLPHTTVFGKFAPSAVQMTDSLVVPGQVDQSATANPDSSAIDYHRVSMVYSVNSNEKTFLYCERRFRVSSG